MEQIIIDNAEVIIGAVAAVLGWVAARLKDKIDLYVAKTSNGWDDAVWAIVRGKLPNRD